MSNVVFILGAGASQSAGAPVMSNFLDVAADLLRSGRVAEKAAQFEAVFTAIGGLQQVHSKAQLDLNNIESIFTALELGRVIRRVPGLNQEGIDETIRALKVLIVSTIETTMAFPVHEYQILPPGDYGELALLLRYLEDEVKPKQSTSVITFNYDIGLDLAMHCKHLGPNYVIEPAPAEPHGISLLKLHGSLNWATEMETKKIRPLHLSDYLARYRVLVGSRSTEIPVPIGSQLVQFFSQHQGQAARVDEEPLIVPPSWNKADYHQALSDVWASAAKHLSEAESIFIIGYSLPETDSFFRHLFALGSVGTSPLRRLVVFNPDPAVDRRFRELLGPGALARYQFFPQDFEYAITAIREYFPSPRRAD
jgi:hypothetical protein